jgi:glucose-6-phosphate isomerase
MGHYLDINVFDQPGVEAGKKYAFEWLNKIAH